MEGLNDAIGLWAFGLGTGVIRVLDREIELILVPLGVAAVLRAPVGQHPRELHLMSVEEGHDAIVQQVGGREWGLAIVELGEGHLGIGVNEALLVDASDPPSCCRRKRCPAPRSSPGTRSRTRRGLPSPLWPSPAQRAGPR